MTGAALATRSLLTAGALALGTLTFPAPAAASLFDDADQRETAAKFIRNFGRFVRWPDSAFPGDSAPLKVCVLGDAPFEQELAAELDGSKAGGREYVLSSLAADDVAAAASCNILFISAESAGAAEPVIEALDGKPVLTVGAAEGFAQAGGMIGLIEERGNLNLQVNKTRLERNFLSASSRLYQVGN
jgi:hypothetical protein